jgi:sugar lactone lactonase YvrE
MPKRHATAGVAVALLLSALITQSSNSWARNDAPQDQVKSSHLSSVRTYAPREFHCSLLDTLSGCLVQQFPYRMAADSQGRVLGTVPRLSVVYVFDTRQRKRWQIRGDPHHRLRTPAYIAVDADANIYVTDLQLSAVLVFQPNGRFKRTIGFGVFNVPSGIWVDQQNRKLYVADWWKSEILLFDLEGKLLRAFGTRGSGPGQLTGPLDIVVHGDTLVVLDSGNFRFELFDLEGNFRGLWPFGVNRTPISFAFDAVGNLYYVDLDSGGLVAMNPQGEVLARFDPQRSFGQWIPRPSLPNFMCVATDGMGHILALRPTLKLEVVELVTDAAR